MAEIKQCYQCGSENPVQAFCGACGSPLALSAYIATQVKDQVADTIRDRDVLEKTSSIAVFEKAWSWMKLVLGIATGLLVIVGFSVFWKASDFWSGVSKAEQSVRDTATKSSGDIVRVSSQSKQDISTALEAAKASISAASNDALRIATQSRSDMSKQTASFRNDLEGSRRQLQAANQIQPEIEGMRKQLAQANSDIQAQQKVLSSSEDFAKSVFSSHMVEYFHIGQPPIDRYRVIPPPSGSNRTVVLLLLQSVPIPQTLQLQFHIFAQPQNSYAALQNLVIFFWADSPDNLKTQQLSAAYFPDKNNKDIIHSLSEHDGRVFADDQPLPKFNQADPDFKGNKWMPLVPAPTQ